MTKLITPQLTALRKKAMKDKNKTEKAVYTSLSAAFKQILVDEKIEVLSEAQEMNILVKQIKQREDSLAMYKKANRKDLADVEAAEIEVLTRHLPKALTDEEIGVKIDEAMASVEDEVGVKLEKMHMKLVMAKLSVLKGKANMGKISGVVNKKLS